MQTGEDKNDKDNNISKEIGLKMGLPFMDDGVSGEVPRCNQHFQEHGLCGDGHG